MAAGKLSEAAAVVTAPKVQSELMSTYNNAAWQWAEKGEKLAEAEQMAKQATEWARAETSRPPTEADASYLTAAQRTQQARSRYSMYADTYAYILDKAGKTRQAVPLMQEVAEGIGQYKNAEYNQRYAEILANAKEGKALQSFAEKAISAGKSTAAIDSLLRVQYVAGKGSDKGYDTYIAGFKKSGEAAARAALQRKMLDKPAPAFSLTDLQGNTVSLEGLRGRVVVVDFWATWCGPCIKSFPAMQKAVNKYKNDPGVKFLFVNTWQQEPDKKKNAADFIAKRGYDFQVLLDEKDEVVSRFGVSGIPTKFVIGPDGRIRFKAVGFEGSDDAVVQELSSMIEVAAGKAPAATAQGSSGR